MRALPAAVIGALVIAAVSTLGDFVWAAGSLQHRIAYGLAHGGLLFLCVGLFLGAISGQAAAGAAIGLCIGLAAAGSFYLLAPLLGYSAMFASWFALWIALGVTHRTLSRRPALAWDPVVRGVLAGMASGLAFYLVSGIWRPFDPQGWDYAVHFGAWTLAYLPGFVILLNEPRRPVSP